MVASYHERCLFPSAVSFESPMHISSPDMFVSKLQCKEFVDIDLVEDSNCPASREYAHEIFAYLREAEVSKESPERW